MEAAPPPTVDRAAEIAEAAERIGISEELASPEGDWETFWEVDSQRAYMERLGRDGDVVRVRTKAEHPDLSVLYVAALEVNCPESTMTDGSFLVEYSTSGEFLSYMQEDAPIHKPLEGEYAKAMHAVVCDSP